jgi:hypothetical protein
MQEYSTPYGVGYKIPQLLPACAGIPLLLPTPLNVLQFKTSINAVHAIINTCTTSQYAAYHILLP